MEKGEGTVINKKFTNYLSVLNNIYHCKLLVLVGAGSGDYIKVLKKIKVKKAILLEADVMQIDKLYKHNKLPKGYEVYQAYICKDSDRQDFYISSFSDMNGCQNIDIFKKIMPNISLLKVFKLQSHTLNTFLEKKKLKAPNWLIVDTYSSYEILKESENILKDVDVLICRYFKKGKKSLIKLLSSNNFQKIYEYEQVNQNIEVCIFTKKRISKNTIEELNKKMQTLTLQSESLNKELKGIIDTKKKVVLNLDLKEKEIELLLKENSEKTKELENKENETKVLEERLKVQEQRFNQEKEELNQNKQAIQKQLEEAYQKLQESTSKVEISQKELTTLKEEKTKLVTALDAKNKDIENLKKEKEEKLKEIESLKKANEEKIKILEAKTNETKALEERLKQQEQKFNQVKEELNKSKQAIQKQHEELNQKLQGATSKVSASQKELTALQEEKVKLETALNAKNKEVESLKKISQEKLKEVEALKKANEKKTKELEARINETKELEEKNKRQEKEFKKERETYEKELKNTLLILKEAIEKNSTEEIKIIFDAEIAFLQKDFAYSVVKWQNIISLMAKKTPSLYYRRLAQVYENINGFPKGNEEQESLSGIEDKHEFLKKLHSVLKPDLYLEIGVQTGKSLVLANCNAIGIDPMPMIKFPLNINHEVFKMSSDVFFETTAKSALTNGIEFSFIDGMHLFEYALRDFINVEQYSKSNTIIVIDDIFPGHPDQASRERKTRAWTGDVWKLVEILKEYRQDLTISLLDIYPTGLMIIENLDNNNSVLHENYKKIVNQYLAKTIKDIYINRDEAIQPNEFLKTLKEKEK